jgi:hypothetical protein
MAQCVLDPGWLDAVFLFHFTHTRNPERDAGDEMIRPRTSRSCERQCLP